MPSDFHLRFPPPRPGEYRPPAPVQIASLVADQRDENLGRTEEISPEQLSPRTVLQLDVKNSPSAGEMITVHLRSRRTSFAGGDIQPPNPIGRLEFGHGGDRASFELDWVNGRQISVPAGSLRVNARANPDAVNLDSVRVGAFIARGTRATCAGSGPQRSLMLVGPGTYPVPTGAFAVSVWNLAVVTPIAWVAGSGGLFGFHLINTLGGEPPRLPVPPDAVGLDVASPFASGRLVFDLEG